MFNCKFFAKIYKSFELEWQRMVFNVATFKCKIIAKKQAKRQKNTKLVQNKAKGAKIFLTVLRVKVLKCAKKHTKAQRRLGAKALRA